MPAPRPVKDPHKELRFTRGRLSVACGIGAALSLLLAIMIAYLGFMLYRRDGEIPAFLSPLFIAPALLLAGLLLRLAILTARHAYILLTPLGIEILPLYRASKRMRAVFWPELKAACRHGQSLRLSLDTDPQETLDLSLLALPSRQQELLIRAVKGRLDKQR